MKLIGLAFMGVGAWAAFAGAPDAISMGNMIIGTVWFVGGKLADIVRNHKDQG